MSWKAYPKDKCRVCGRMISVAGWANYNHCMMHVRRGEMTRHTHKYGPRLHEFGYHFRPTGSQEGEEDER